MQNSRTGEGDQKRASRQGKLCEQLVNKKNVRGGKWIEIKDCAKNRILLRVTKVNKAATGYCLYEILRGRRTNSIEGRPDTTSVDWRLLARQQFGNLL